MLQDNSEEDGSQKAGAEDQESSLDENESELAPKNWHKRMRKVVQNCNFSGKERKTCQKCHRVYPFFKTECNYCQYKFPKTRLGASTGIQTESYTLQFWSRLR